MPDYMFQLESRLSPEQRAAMVRIQELATESEANLYLVGGAVRDVVSGMSIRDLDFTIEGNPSRIIRELEKGGAKLMRDDESLRSAELVLSGEVDASISAAREDIYARPGAKPDTRFSTIMEDLRRRDFSVNAIAISLNPNSRGLLLDPTNGLADLERREIRALSIHSFTNQPVRLLRALRYEARMGFKMESRTKDWFNLALEREMQGTISHDDAGSEFRQVAREEKPAAVLKSWESHGLMGVVHPLLEKRHPDYDAINRMFRVREDMVSSGLRPRLFAPVTVAILGRLKDNERKSVLGRMSLPSSELRSVNDVEPEALKIVKLLSGPKTAGRAMPMHTWRRRRWICWPTFLPSRTTGKPWEKFGPTSASGSRSARHCRVSPRSSKFSEWSAARNSIKWWKISSSCSSWAARASPRTTPRFCANLPASRNSPKKWKKRKSRKSRRRKASRDLSRNQPLLRGR